MKTKKRKLVKKVVEFVTSAKPRPVSNPIKKPEAPTFTKHVDQIALETNSLFRQPSRW